MNELAAVLMSAPLVLAIAILPGAAWVLAAGPAGRSRAESAGTALALSPGLFGGAIALQLVAGVPLRTATAWAIAGFTLAAVFAAWIHRRRAAPGGTERPSGARLTWWSAAVVTGAVGLFPLLSEWWRIYSDAWNHFAITRAILEHGAHPVDPFFAGLPLQYPWIYHAQMASLEAGTHAGLFGLMSLWSAIALASLLLCAGPLAARLHRRSPGWALVLLLLGLNAAFPVFAPLLLVKAMTGTVRGWPEVVRAFSLVPFGVSRVTVFLQSLGGQDYFLNKFMVATPFALGLAAFTAFAASLLRWLDGRDRRELWIAAGALLSGGLMHPVVALDLVGATLGLAALAGIAPRAAGLTRASAAALALAVLAAAAPVMIFTSGILGGAGGSHRELPLDLSAWKMLGLYSTLALGLLLALGPVRAFARQGGGRRAWVAWITLQLAIATVIRLPGGSSFYTIDKFAYFVWIPLALTAGAGLQTFLARRGAAARAALLCLMFVPVNGLALSGRAFDANASARQPWRLPGLVWMRAHLPANAVVLVPYGDPVTGNYVRRDQYIVEESLGLQLGYPAAEMAARRSLAERFFATDSLLPADALRLRGLGRPVYAVWTRFSDPRLAVTPRALWLSLAGTTLPGRPPHWEGRYPIVYASDTHVVAELVPPRDGGVPARGTGVVPSR